MLRVRRGAGLADGLTGFALDLAREYGEDGRYSCYLLGGQGGPAEADRRLAAVLRALPFRTVAFQAYRDGWAVTDWHDDLRIANEATSCILSVGGTRTFSIRRRDGEQLDLEVAHDDLVVMAGDFHRLWEHRISPDPGAGERWSFVFRDPV